MKRTFSIDANVRLFFHVFKYFLFFLIPILLIGFAAYLNNIRNLEQKLSNQMYASLTSTSRSVDAILNSVESLQTNFFNNRAVQKNLTSYAKMSLEQKSNVSEVTRILSSDLSLVASYVDEIFVFNDNEWVYRSTGVESFANFFSDFYRYDKYDARYWTELREVGNHFHVLSPSTIVNRVTGLTNRVIPIVKSEFIDGFQTAIVVNISVKEIRNEFTTSLADPSIEYMVLDERQNLILSSEDEKSLTIRQLIGEVPRIAAQEKAEVNLLGAGGQPVLMSCVKSGKYSWTYCAYTPLVTLQSKSSQIFNLTVWLCIAFLCIGVCLSILFTHRMYRPIRNIRDVLQEHLKPHVPAGSRLAMNKLGQLNSGIVKLINYNQESRNKSNEFSNRLLDQAVYSIFSKREDSDEAFIREVLENCGLSGESFACFCIGLNYKTLFHRLLEEKDRELVTGNMKRILYGILSQKIAVRIVEMSRNRYICLASLEQGKQHLFLQALNHFLEVFSYDLRYCGVKIGVGRIYSDVHDIHRSFDEALTALRQAQGKSDFEMVQADHVTIKLHYVFSWTDRQSVTNSLQMGNGEEARKKLERILEDNIQAGASSLSIETMMSEMYRLAACWLQETGHSVEEILTETERSMLAGRTDEFDLSGKRLLLLELFERASACAQTRLRSAEDPLVTQIAQYIEAHIRQDVYLDKIAEALGYSPKYISRYFKKQTMSNITDYINETKINEAKKLLKSPELKISQIHEKVGLTNRTTFLRLFKKYTGLSPADYRRVFPPK